MSRTASRVLACGVMVGVLVAGCARERPSLGSTGPSGDLPSVGDLPEDRAGVPDVAVVTCEVDEESGNAFVEVRAVVTNNRPGPRILQGVPLTVTVDGRTVSDDHELWSSATIGPGRQTLVETTIDIAGSRGDAECEPGEPDLRPAGQPAGRDLDGSDIELEGCDDGDLLRVHNPTDQPVGVVAAVEFFDRGGYSVGTMELGQFPTTYTDGSHPDADEVALPGGEWGEYPVEIGQRIADWEVPHEGPVTSCQVVAAAYEVDPEPIEVIVD